MVGMGNIGAGVFRLLAPFDLGRKLAYDPTLRLPSTAELSVELVDIETVFRESDVISISAPPHVEDARPGRRPLAQPDGNRPPTSSTPTRSPISLAKNQDDLVAALRNGA